MKISHLCRKIGLIVIAAMMSVAVVGGYAWADDDTSGDGDTSGGDVTGNVRIEPEKEAQCATILGNWCDSAETDGEATIKEIITFVISILSIGIGVLATIGMIICGYLIMSARDNEAQVTKAKRRMVEIVIGIVLWALGSLVLLLVIPDSDAASHVQDGAVIMVKEIG